MNYTDESGSAGTLLEMLEIAFILLAIPAIFVQFGKLIERPRKTKQEHLEKQIEKLSRISREVMGISEISAAIEGSGATSKLNSCIESVDLAIEALGRKPRLLTDEQIKGYEDALKEIKFPCSGGFLPSGTPSDLNKLVRKMITDCYDCSEGLSVCPSILPGICAKLTLPQSNPSRSAQVSPVPRGIGSSPDGQGKVSPADMESGSGRSRSMHSEGLSSLRNILFASRVVSPVSPVTRVADGAEAFQPHTPTARRGGLEELNRVVEGDVQSGRVSVATIQ